MTGRADPAEIRAAVGAVPDPELPPVTLGMLGVVHDVAVDDDGRVTVELLPTFSGCPAQDVMERDVAAALAPVPGVERVTVRWRYAPPWTPDRISAEGRERLREFGIAPPPDGPEVPDGARRLPVAGDPRPCPYCGGTDTVRDSRFGPTPCRDLRFCEACGEPFEAVKT